MKKKDVTIILLVAGIGLICVGVFAGQHTAVLHKAVRICMECVGLG